eukprot:INCI13502.1.p2 GENE.INCI13502.1~~INCI13502.1.p2  ORF type:complete len:214 (+),score=51.09 INCI13502.1:330-971(+)
MFPRSNRFGTTATNTVPGPGEYEVLGESSINGSSRRHTTTGKQFGTSKRFDKTYAVLQDMSAIKNRRATSANLGTPDAAKPTAALLRKRLIAATDEREVLKRKLSEMTLVIQNQTDMHARVQELEQACKMLEKQLEEAMASRNADQEQFAASTAAAQEEAARNVELLREQLEADHATALENHRLEVSCCLFLVCQVHGASPLLCPRDFDYGCF